MPESTLYINGAWVASSDGAVREIRSPHDNSVVATVSEATAADTRDAIKAARDSFDSGVYASWSMKDRCALVEKVAGLIKRDAEILASLETRDTGKRMIETRYDMADIEATFRHFAALGLKLKDRKVDVGADNISSVITHEAVGVCALIGPWNYPLLQISWKVAPALVAGCSFIVKPSELSPSTAIHLMKLLEEAGLPQGVANLICGAGATAGAPLTEDPRVDLVSFTGGLVTGRRIMATAAQTVKKVALELGGKNPHIIFENSNIDAAIDNAVTGAFLHSGQVCSAGTRVLVEKSIHDRVVAEIVRRAKAIYVGGPEDPRTETGPLISKEHLGKVEAYMHDAEKDGATILVGGSRIEREDLNKGWYFPPTVIDNCLSKMKCVQDESFGPIMTIETFESVDEAIALGNDTIYGLSGALWCDDEKIADRVAAALRHGTIWVNDFGPYRPQAEWGGFKASGVGRELGEAGLDEYLEIKHIWTNNKPARSGWFADPTLGEYMSSAAPMISVQNVWKVFGNNPEKVIGSADANLSRTDLRAKTGNTIAVRDVSFDVAPGEVFVVMGLSGSGKSTLVRCMTRLIEPTQGQMKFEGEDILKVDDKRLRELRKTRFSMVFQHFGLLPHRKVIDNIAYSLEINGAKKDARHARANEVIELVGLQGYANAYPEQLSGGMQQRVGLARALAVDPQVLFLDEPFSALDPLIRRDMQQEIIRLHHELGKTMVFITHDLSEAVKVGDRIAIMRDGAIVQIGTPEDLVANPADEYVANFVRDIAKSHVLTLKHLARKAGPGDATDGPELAANTIIRDAAQVILQSHKPVRVNDNGTALGIVSSEDVLRLISGGA